MDPVDKILKELEGMQNVIKGSFVDKKSFGGFVQSLSGAWHKLRAAIEAKLNTTTDEIYSKMAQFKSVFESEIAANRAYISGEVRGIRNENKTLATSLKDEMQKLRTHIQSVEDSIPHEFDPSSLEKQLETVRRSIPKVVTLQEVWDRFDKIDKKIRAIEDTKPSVIRQVFGGGRPVHVPMVDDWSGFTDGSTKQFYLTKAPRSLATIKIWGSDFPYILRANVDFTITGKLVTLTSDVDAPSNGATLICEYYI